jgi:hypothetical protein
MRVNISCKFFGLLLAVQDPTFSVDGSLVAAR